MFYVSERYFRNSDVRNFNFLLVHAHLAAVSNEAKFVISFWQTFFRAMQVFALIFACTITPVYQLSGGRPGSE